MLDLFCPLKLTGVAASVCKALGIEAPESADARKLLRVIATLC